MGQQLDFLNDPKTIQLVNPTPLEHAINRTKENTMQTEAFDQVKPNDIKHRPDKLPDLGYFTGTENYYRHPMPLTPYEFNYTDGVKHVAEYAGAYWLLDVIFSHTAEIYRSKAIPSERKRLLVCKLAVGDNNHAIFVITDGDGGHLTTQLIEYTDFPAKTIDVWVQNGVAMLPSEY